MTDCPFMPGVSICDMSLFDMISTSHGLINLYFTFTRLFVADLVNFRCFVFGPLLRWFLHQLILLDKGSGIKKNHLLQFSQEAFSSGLLHSKAFLIVLFTDITFNYQ